MSQPYPSETDQVTAIARTHRFRARRMSYAVGRQAIRIVSSWPAKLRTEGLNGDRVLLCAGAERSHTRCRGVFSNDRFGKGAEGFRTHMNKRPYSGRCREAFQSQERLAAPIFGLLAPQQWRRAQAQIAQSYLTSIAALLPMVNRNSIMGTNLVCCNRGVLV